MVNAAGLVPPPPGPPIPHPAVGPLAAADELPTPRYAAPDVSDAYPLPRREAGAQMPSGSWQAFATTPNPETTGAANPPVPGAGLEGLTPRPPVHPAAAAESANALIAGVGARDSVAQPSGGTPEQQRQDGASTGYQPPKPASASYSPPSATAAQPAASAHEAEPRPAEPRPAYQPPMRRPSADGTGATSTPRPESGGAPAFRPAGPWRGDQAASSSPAPRHGMPSTRPSAASGPALTGDAGTPAARTGGSPAFRPARSGFTSGAGKPAPVDAAATAPARTPAVAPEPQVKAADMFVKAADVFGTPTVAPADPSVNAPSRDAGTSGVPATDPSSRHGGAPAVAETPRYVGTSAVTETPSRHGGAPAVAETPRYTSAPAVAETSSQHVSTRGVSAIDAPIDPPARLAGSHSGAHIGTHSAAPGGPRVEPTARRTVTPAVAPIDTPIDPPAKLVGTHAVAPIDTPIDPPLRLAGTHAVAPIDTPIDPPLKLAGTRPVAPIDPPAKLAGSRAVAPVEAPVHVAGTRAVAPIDMPIDPPARLAGTPAVAPIDTPIDPPARLAKVAGAPVQAVPAPVAEVAVPKPVTPVAVPKPVAPVPTPSTEVAVPKPVAQVAGPTPSSELALPKPAAQVAGPKPSSELALPKPTTTRPPADPSKPKAKLPTLTQATAFTTPDVPAKEPKDESADREDGKSAEEVALETRRKEDRAALRRAEILLATGDANGALAEAGPAMARLASDADVWLLMARIRIALDDIPGALRATETAAKLNPGGAAVLAVISDAMSAAGRNDEALAAARAALEAEPGNPHLQHLVATRLVENGTDRSEADKLARAAVAAMPDEPAFQATAAITQGSRHRRGRGADADAAESSRTGTAGTSTVPPRKALALGWSGNPTGASPEEREKEKEKPAGRRWGWGRTTALELPAGPSGAVRAEEEPIVSFVESLRGDAPVMPGPDGSVIEVTEADVQAAPAYRPPRPVPKLSDEHLATKPWARGGPNSMTALRPNGPNAADWSSVTGGAGAGSSWNAHTGSMTIVSSGLGTVRWPMARIGLTGVLGAAAAYASITWHLADTARLSAGIALGIMVLMLVQFVWSLGRDGRRALARAFDSARRVTAVVLGLGGAVALGVAAAGPDARMPWLLIGAASAGLLAALVAATEPRSGRRSPGQR